MDYSSTQVNLPTNIAAVVRGLESQISPADLHPTEKQSDFPHITVLYGLQTDDPGPVREIMENIGPVKASITGIEVFRPEDKAHDVLVMTVDSPDLCALHEGLCGLPHANTFPVYRPHCTIAYLLPGKGDAYRTMVSGLEGNVITFDTLVFSNQKEQKSFIPLTPLLNMDDVYKTVKALRIKQ